MRLYERMHSVDNVVFLIPFRLLERLAEGHDRVLLLSERGEREYHGLENVGLRLDNYSFDERRNADAVADMTKA